MSYVCLFAARLDFDRGLHIVVAIGADGGVTPGQTGSFVVQLRAHPRRESAHSSRSYCFDLAVAQRVQ